MTMRLNGSAFFTSIIAFFFLIMLLGTIGLSFGAWIYPVTVGIPCLALALLQLIWDLKGVKQEEQIYDIAPDRSISSNLIYKRASLFLGWILGLYGAIWFLGFKLGFLLFLVLFLKFEGRCGWLITAALSALMVFILLAFEHLLGVHWPEGWIESYLKVPL